MTEYSEYTDPFSASTPEVAPATVVEVPDLKVYWYVPPVVLRARVNMPAVPSYPVQQITFDGTTEGTYLNCAGDMFFTLGSAEGLDDYGRGRLRSAATVNTLKIGRASRGLDDGQITLVDNAYITVYRDWRVMSKVPYIAPNGTIYMDGDIAVGDWMENPPPKANMGPARAKTIDPDTGLARFYFPGSTSFAVAPGATISAHAWVVQDGTIVLGGDASDPDIYVDFPAGVRWVSLTVTDSNGKQHSTQRLVYAHDPDDDPCIKAQVTNQTLDEHGQTLTLRLLQDLPRAEYSDGGHILVWEDREVDPDDYSNMVCVGWHESESASSSAEETHLVRNTEIKVLDAAGRLEKLRGFSNVIEVPDEDEPVTWATSAAPNVDLYLCYLLQWYSTVFTLADFTPSGTWEDYSFVIFQSDGDTLFNQVQRKASQIVPDHNFVCNSYGQLAVVVNQQLLDPEDRNPSVQASFTAQWWTEIELSYTRTPQVATLRASAMVATTEWLIDIDGKKTLPTAFSIAPGYAPGQGSDERTQGEQLCLSQDQLNAVTGHRLANMNSRYGPIYLTPVVGDHQGIQPALGTWVYLVTTTETAPQRGIEFETSRCLAKEVSIDYQYPDNGMVLRRARIKLELETWGEPAVTEVQEDALPVDEVPEAPPGAPDYGLITGQGLIWGMGEYNGYRTSNFDDGSPTWERVDLLPDTSEKFYSWVVDPFSPGYLGTGAINAYAVTQVAVYRITDLFGTTGIEAIHTFAVPTSGPDEYRTIQASFGAFFESGNPWILVVSYYADNASRFGTWALRSLDGGATFEEEVIITGFYSTTGEQLRPAVYTSPKTPGLALAFAQWNISDYGAAFQSDNWGETWYLRGSGDDPEHPLPLWGVFPHEATSPNVLGYSPTMSYVATASEVGSTPGVDEDGFNLFPAPPADTVRLELSVVWTYEKIVEGGSSGVSAGLQTDNNEAQISQTGDDNFSSTASGGGSFDITWERISGTDWPVNRDTLISSPPTNPASVGGRFNAFVNANAIGSGNEARSQITLSATITEIELEDGTIYEPVAPINLDSGYGLSGDMHVPWEDNDDESIIYFAHFGTVGARIYRLKRASGATIDDISPSSGGVEYGVHHYGFAIRAYDSDRQKVLVGGRGNDLSTAEADDTFGLWYSANAGDTFTELIAPVAATEVLYGISAAFAGDDSDTMFVWGGYADSDVAILYSTDTGDTLQDKSGNLASLEDVEFGAIALIGIAGGPTG